MGKVKILEEEELLEEYNLGWSSCCCCITGDVLESEPISAIMPPDPEPDPLKAPLLLAEEEEEEHLGKANLIKGGRFLLGGRGMLNWAEREKGAIVRRVRWSEEVGARVAVVVAGVVVVVVMVRTHLLGLT